MSVLISTLAKRQKMGTGLDEPILIEVAESESEAPRRKGPFLVDEIYLF